MNKVIGFHQHSDRKTDDKEKKSKKKEDVSVTECILDAYFLHNHDSGRWTSQDICDNLRDMADLEPAAVTKYMMAHEYRLERDDDRLVWVKDI